MLVACAGMEEAEEVAEYYREVEEEIDEDGGGGGGGKEFYEFQPLPTLLEDEVSCAWNGNAANAAH